MRDFTTYEFAFGKRKALPLVAGLVLLPFLGMGQSVEQVKKIREESNLVQLNKVQRVFKKNELSTNQLKTLAKKKKVAFSGEIDGKSYQLVGFDKWTDAPLYYVTYNAGASAGTGASKLNSTGGVFELDGDGMTVHEWDGGGVLVGHQEFGGRATQKDVPGGVSEHSTHVGGTMIASGVEAAAKGMAPKANLDAYDWNSDKTEMINAATNGALLSNHSYGFISGFSYGDWSGVTGWHWLGSDEDTEFKGYGKYTEEDINWDLVALGAPYYLPVKSAGNDRGGGPAPGGEHFVRINGVWVTSTKVRQRNGGDDGYDVLYTGSLGKNILTVGAAQKVGSGYKQASDVQMASFSSFGPVDDGRIKPDISGIGVNLYSSSSSGVDGYTSMSGTSMASPNVTGSLLLLQEHYKNLNSDAFMKAATLKALAVGTANEAGEFDGPDYGSGWGLLNVYDAAIAISTRDKYSLIKEDSLSNGATKTVEVKASGLEPLKVTIAWTDPVVSPDMLPSEENNDRTSVLVNDLDVKVLMNGETYLPWKLDPANPGAAATKGDNMVDNVEQVVIPTPEKGATYQIQVTHKGTLKKNELKEVNGDLEISLVDADSQDYSMVVTGINEGVNVDLKMEKVEVTVSPKEYSSETPVKFYVQNLGSETATGGKLVYELVNKDTNQVEKTGEVELEDLNASETVVITENVDLSKSFVNYAVKGRVEIAGDEIEVNNVAEESVYGYLVDLRPEENKYSFGFEKDLEMNGWKSEDKDANGRTWVKYDEESFSKSGVSFALNFPNRVNGSDDWLFTPPIFVKANTKYRVIYNALRFQELDENIAVYMGEDANSTAMTTELGKESLSLVGNIDKRYARYFYEFETTEDKVIYIGFNNKVDADKASYAVALDDVAVERSAGAPDVDFLASKYVTNTYEAVSFKGNIVEPSMDPATSYEWVFTPNTVTYENGTNANSLNTEVRFQNVGKYTVELKATNGAGEGSKVKTDYVEVKNEVTKAGFTASKELIYEGEVVSFTNTSTGSPAPTEFEWTITPSEGFELQSATTDRDLVVKFVKSGKYSVKLKATSANNSDELTQEDFITVIGTHDPVKGLAYELNDDSYKLDLTWERPSLLPLYLEQFNGEEVPADMKVYDNNADGRSWSITGVGNNGTQGVMNYSWFFAAFDADDWLVTPKLKAGAETLKYMVELMYPERYDIYVVPATTSGTHPTVEEIKANGTVVYTNELAAATGDGFNEVSVDLSENNTTDFFLAFHHRTKAEDDGFRLVLDDVMVGYKDSPYMAGNGVSKELFNDEAKVARMNQDKGLVTMSEPYVLSNNSDSGVVVNFGVLDLPTLTGYRVEKDGTTMESISGIDNTMYTETLDAKGTYTYSVYAVYSDGESDPVTVTVDANSLATSEVEAGKELQVYPNPSNGMFVVMNESGVTSFTTEVYNMAGQVIYQNKFKGNKAELNLTKYPSGVYILKVVDNNGGQQSVKIVIK